MCNITKIIIIAVRKAIGHGRLTGVINKNNYANYYKFNTRLVFYLKEKIRQIRK